jgi:hypothetical protein
MRDQTSYLTGLVRVDFTPPGRFTSDYQITPSPSINLTWDYKEGSRKRGAVSRPGTPGERRGATGWLPYSAEAVRYRAWDVAQGAEINFLRSPGTVNDPIGQGLITEKVRDLKADGLWLLEYLACRMSVDYEVTVPVAEGPDYTVWTGLPAALYGAHVKALDSSFASWAAAGTRIKPQIDAANQLVRETYGVDCRVLLMNSVTFNSTLLANTEFQTWASKHERIVDELLTTGRIESGFFGYGIELIDDSYDSKGQDETTVLAKFIPDNQVSLVCADPSKTRPTLYECPPEDAGITAPTGITGWYSGAWVVHNPPGIGLVVNYSFLPVRRIPAWYTWADITKTS